MERKAPGAISPWDSIWMGEVQSSLMLGENSYPQVGTGLGAVPGAGATWVLVQGTHGVGIGSTEKWASGGHLSLIHI